MIDHLILAAAAAAIQLQPGCKDPETQTEMTICAGRRAKAADAAMVRTYKVALTKLRSMDPEIDRENDKRPTYSTALLASQRAWLKFRDAQCEIEGFSARGGSMEPMIVYACLEEVTRSRTKQLQALTKSYSEY